MKYQSTLNKSRFVDKIYSSLNIISVTNLLNQSTNDTVKKLSIKSITNRNIPLDLKFLMVATSYGPCFWIFDRYIWQTITMNRWHM